MSDVQEDNKKLLQEVLPKESDEFIAFVIKGEHYSRIIEKEKEQTHKFSPDSNTRDYFYRYMIEYSKRVL